MDTKAIEPGIKPLSTEAVRVVVNRVTPAASVDEIAEALTVVESFKHIAKELEVELKRRMLEHVEENGPVKIGTIRYYAGSNRTVKCRDSGVTLEALLKATGGDVEQIAKLFASQPFKHGACRDVLGDEWAKCFETADATVLKEGKPVKELQTADVRFNRRKGLPDTSQT